MCARKTLAPVRARGAWFGRARRRFSGASAIFEFPGLGDFCVFWVCVRVRVRVRVRFERARPNRAKIRKPPPRAGGWRKKYLRAADARNGGRTPARTRTARAQNFPGRIGPPLWSCLVLGFSRFGRARAWFWHAVAGGRAAKLNPQGEKWQKGTKNRKLPKMVKPGNARRATPAHAHSRALRAARRSTSAFFGDVANSVPRARARHRRWRVEKIALPRRSTLEFTRKTNQNIKLM
jgi:hypothetical protein